MLKQIFRRLDSGRNWRRVLIAATAAGRGDILTVLKRCKHGEVTDDIPMPAEADKGPFYGIRVLDLSSGLCGPYCSQVLGDMGAEVIKIEHPEHGDESRQWGPRVVGNDSCFFISTNRNKKSIAIDVYSTQGKEIVHELVQTSDVFLENFPPKNKAESIGYGYEELNKINNRLIYASITGFGIDSKKAGNDIVASAIGGLMNITGPEDGGPCIGGVSVTDMITGMYINGAITSALYEREFTDRGKQIHCSLMASQIAYLSHIASNYLNTGLVGKRHGCAHGTIVPYQSFETGDDHEIVIGVTNDKFFKATCQALNSPDLFDDPRFESNAKRVANREELIPILQDRFFTEPSLYWIERLEELGVPCGRVNNMADVFSLPQVHALGLVQSIPHPTVGIVKVPGPAFKMEDRTTPPHSAEPPTALHPPLLGEHTVDILKDILMYSHDQIHELLENEVVSTSCNQSNDYLSNLLETKGFKF